MATYAQTLETRPGLSREERLSLLACFGSILLAILFPYPPTKLVLGPILLITFLYTSLRAFHLAVCWFVFILPLLTLITNESMVIRGMNVQTLFILMFIGFAVVARERQAPEDVPQVEHPALAPLIALFVLVVISSVHSHLAHGYDLGDLLARAKNWFSYSIFAYLAFRFVTGRKEKLFVLCTIFFVTTLHAAYSLRDIVTNPTLNIAHHRAVSLFTIQPNLHGGFLALYSFFFLSFLIFFPARRLVKLLVLGGTIVVLVNLVYTLSRGAWFAFLAGAMFLSTMKSRKLLIPLLLLGAGLMYWAPDVATERWESGFEGEYDPRFLAEDNVTVDEAASRIVQWKTFLPLLAERPFIGIGFGHYPVKIFREGIDYKTRSAHSSIIEIGIEEGLLGLCFYFWILIANYRGASRVFARTADPLEKALALGVMGSVVALAVLDMSGTRFRNANVMAFFWILTGITLNSSTRDKEVLGA